MKIEKTYCAGLRTNDSEKEPTILYVTTGVLILTTVTSVLIPIIWWLGSIIIPFICDTYVDYWNFFNYTE